jgi:hypothetical protein
LEDTTFWSHLSLYRNTNNIQIIYNFLGENKQIIYQPAKEKLNKKTCGQQSAAAQKNSLSPVQKRPAS